MKPLVGVAILIARSAYGLPRSSRRPAPIGLPSAGTLTSQTVFGLASIALADGPNSAPARLAGSYVAAASFLNATISAFGVAGGGGGVFAAGGGGGCSRRAAA